MRLNGGADELSGRARDTYVVSEDDYIDYLSQSKLSELLPVDLAARLRRSHLLFVGYDLEDWSPRVFLRRLWGEERISFKSWAITEMPNRLTAEQWRQLGVDILDVPSTSRCKSCNSASSASWSTGPCREHAHAG